MKNLKKIVAILMIVFLNMSHALQVQAIEIEDIADAVITELSESIGADVASRLSELFGIITVGGGGGDSDDYDLLGGVIEDAMLDSVDPVTDKVLSEILLIDKDELQKSTSKVNSLENKGIAPEVELMFTPEMPRTGEEITATAFPINFNDIGDEFYFTWYLKHENENTDWDENGKIDMEDYKIEAMRLIANGGYDYRKANYDGGDSDNDGINSMDNEVCSGGDDEDCTKAAFGGINIKEPDTGFRCYVKDFEGGEILEIISGSVTENTEEKCPDTMECSILPDSICRHNFPHAPGYVTGDGEFTDGEEEFWGTNPDDPDTNDDGVNDEASIAGVGMDKLTWLYSPGDEVGVIVEGIAMGNTRHDDASQMIMYAMPKNNFDVNGTDCKIDDGKVEDYWTKVSGSVNIPVPSIADYDITKCLEHNFIDPMDGNQPRLLNLQLKHSPKKPKNSTTGQGGDQLIVRATMDDPGIDPNRIYYRWTVEQSDSYNSAFEDWDDLSSSATFRDEAGIEYLEGLGLDVLKMNLNISGLDKYVKVTVETEEYYDDNVSRGGSTSDVIQINNDEGNMIKLSSNTSDGEICEDEDVCFALNNQIIEATVEDNGNNGYRNYLWTINGKNVGARYNDGDEKQGPNVSFPILGKPGDIYTISVIANDTATVDASGSKNEGNELQASRTMMIIEPFLRLTPLNGAEPKLLGEYVGLDGEIIEDESDGVFVAEFGGDTEEEIIEVAAEFVPEWLPMDDVEIKWTVGGEELTDFNDSVLTIDTKSYPDGSSFDISAKATYVQDQETRIALRDSWNISQFKTGAVELTGQVSVEKSINSDLAAKGNAPMRVMASLVSGFPGQMMFLVRIALTMTMVVVVSSLLMSFERKRV